MSAVWKLIVFLLAAYLFGAIPFALLLGKLRGVDIRQYASGNIGATNLTRVLGRGWGIFCFILDFLKGALPVLLATMTESNGYPPFMAELTAAAAVAGHVWPVYLRFKGGKGVATTLGALLALTPWSVIAAALVWWVCFHFSRYVSFASLAAAITLPTSYLFAAYGLQKTNFEFSRLVLLVILTLSICWRHRQNAQRLWSGQEHRFNRKNKVD